MCLKFDMPLNREAKPNSVLKGWYDIKQRNQT